MKHLSILELRNLVLDSGLGNQENVIGMTGDEISQLEATIGKQLPAVYREFLKYMGKSAGRLPADIITYPDLLKHMDLPLMLADDSGFDVPSNAVVFLIGDTEFAYFETGVSDDPPVFMYRQRNGNAEKVIDSLSGWMNDFFQIECELHIQNSGSPKAIKLDDPAQRHYS